MLCFLQDIFIKKTVRRFRDSVHCHLYFKRNIHRPRPSLQIPNGVFGNAQLLSNSASENLLELLVVVPVGVFNIETNSTIEFGLTEKKKREVVRKKHLKNA